MKKVTYIRCPRCELNYITKAEKYCSVCKQEMQVGGGNIYDESELEICPICKTNYIQPDEIMCPTCYAERANDPNFDGDEDKEWNEYINRDEEDMITDNPDEELGDMARVKDLSLDDDDDLDDEFDDDDDLGVVIDDDEDDEDDDEDDEYDNYDDEDDEDYDDDDDEDDEDDDD